MSCDEPYKLQLNIEYYTDAGTIAGTCVGTCTSLSFYQFNSSRCYPQIAHCRIRSNQSLLHCDQCEVGSYLIRSQGAVDVCAMLEHCQTLNSQNQKRCEQCEEGYQRKVSDNYELAADECIQPIAHCESYGGSWTQCLWCESGYYLNQSGTDECVTL